MLPLRFLQNYGYFCTCISAWPKSSLLNPRGVDVEKMYAIMVWDPS